MNRAQTKDRWRNHETLRFYFSSFRSICIFDKDNEAASSKETPPANGFVAKRAATDPGAEPEPHGCTLGCYSEGDFAEMPPLLVDISSETLYLGVAVMT